jgi:cell wall-associated NlpC family hydrolase
VVSNWLLRTAAIVASATFAVMLVPNPGHANPSPDDVVRELTAASDTLEITIERYNVARDEVQLTEVRLAAATAQLAPLQAAADQGQQAINEMASSAYRSAGVSPVNALLSTTSADVLMDQLTILGHLASERAHLVAEAVAARDRYASEQQSLQALAAQQHARVDDLAGQRTVIETRIDQLEQMRSRASRSQPTMRSPAAAAPRQPSPPETRPPAVGSNAASAAVRFVYAQLGKPYRWGAEGPDSFDCSGLTKAAWGAAGVGLPHSAAGQFGVVRRVDRADLRPGDLVFYYRDVHHVGMYVGDGRVIDAPRTGERIAMRQIDFVPIAGYGRPA